MPVSKRHPKAQGSLPGLRLNMLLNKEKIIQFGVILNWFEQKEHYLFIVWKKNLPGTKGKNMNIGTDSTYYSLSDSTGQNGDRLLLNAEAANVA